MPMSLEAARINADLSRSQVCAALNLHLNTLTNYEKYKTKPDIERATQIAAVYGCKLDDNKWSKN